MAKIPPEVIKKAERMFRRGKSQAEIARSLNVSYKTVRAWRKKYDWQGEVKKGPPKGNRNAAGAPGNPHPNPPPDRTVHGAYSKVYLDALSDEEKDLLLEIPMDEEDMLIEQIQVFYIRERRILKAIRKYMEAKEPLVPSDVIRTEERRSFNDPKDEVKYENMMAKKVEAGVMLPGKPYSIQTRMTNKDTIIIRLETELSTVQRSKTRSIEALARLRAEKARVEGEKAGDSAVDEWLASVLEVDANG